MKKRWIFPVIASLALAGCSNESITNLMGKAPQIKAETETGKMLRNLPSAKNKAVVAVYDFEDQTGQHKPNDRLAEFSRAVTQGGAAILNEALTKAGNGSWFRVIERKGLDNLLRERQIIAATREQYSGQKTKLPPMLYAGMLLEGGIVSYESNTMTGGVGGRYLGIGGQTEYRQDVVTVYLRAVNVQNGEVLLSTNASKTIFSTAVGGSVFKYVAFDEILEIETGFTVNEPPQFAVRQAIESAVYSMVMEGAGKGLWQFANGGKGKFELQKYKALLNGESVPERPEPRKIVKKNPVRTPIAVRKPAKPVVAAPVRKVQASPVRKVNSVPVKSLKVNSLKLPKALPEVTKPKIAPVQVSPVAEPRNAQKAARPVAKKDVSNTGERPYRDSSRYAQPSNGKTKLYCTPSGCYPFPPNK